jgi:cycloeucalenol cycloisomerase
LWIAIFGFVGNYFWTHYFYVVLGATYSFPSYKINYVSECFCMAGSEYFVSSIGTGLQISEAAT